MTLVEACFKYLKIHSLITISIYIGLANFSYAGECQNYGFGPVGCDFFWHYQECVNQIGCTWATAPLNDCFGTPQPCESHKFKNICSQVLGCQWVESGLINPLTTEQNIVDSLSLKINSDPQNATAYMLRGQTYFQLKQNQNAINDFTKVLELTSKNAAAYTARGKSYEQLGENRKAINDLLEAITILETEKSLLLDKSIKMLWPGQGKLVNNYPQAVQCWTGEPNPSTGNEHLFLVPGEGGVSPPDIDVDHIQAPDGQWWKVGWNMAVVERSGDVRNAECKTPNFNQPCQ